MSIKYKVSKDTNGQYVRWVVKSVQGGRQKATYFETKSEAERFAQSCVEDDIWCAANRD